MIQNGTAEWPGALLILVESPKDIVLIRGGEWLTLKQGLAIGCAMVFFVTAALAWVMLLRRTVRKQTAIIRARLENELQLETKFRRLFERNLAAVFSWRSDGVIVDCNVAFVKLLGLRSREDLIGRSYWDFQADPAFREQLRGTLQEEALSNCDVSLRRDDGVILHLLKNITPVQTAEGMLYETTAIDVTQLRLNQAELQTAKDAAVFDSLNDPLTGLPNRRLLLDTLSSMLGIARSEGGMIALLYIDLDGFKLVNDSLGHPIGDALLVQMADCLRSWIRERDILGRLGGDEFVVILDRLHNKEDAVLVAENLLDGIASPFKVEGHELKIGASIGISIFPENASDAEELMKQADSAMYAAKRAGKNRVMSFTPEIGSLVHERLSLEILLRGAIARHEIFVQYQPEFDLAGNRLIRFEALARWTHPTLGSIPPVKFIPIAEESGLIDVLGAFILDQA
jgi:diguanylate cyclase (GGDEF)-like protein/PAS domain S-box-containing protein